MSSAATLNPFQLLGDTENDDPIEISASIPRPAPKPAAAPSPEPAKKAPGPSKLDGETGRGGRGGRGVAARGTGRGPPSGRGPKPAGPDESIDLSGASPHMRVRQEGRGRGEGRGAAGEGRAGRGRGGRRQFDRHDGTGRGYVRVDGMNAAMEHEVAKKGGAGKGNWGVEGEQEPLPGAPADPTAPDEAAIEAVPDIAAEADAADVGGEAAEEEEEPPTMSLEDYEKMMAEKREGLNKKGDVSSVDTSQFEGMATVKRADMLEDETLDVSGSKGKKERVKKEKTPAATRVADVGFTVAKDDYSGGGRGRGGRGGGRGGRGDRRSDRGERRDGDGRGGRGGRGGSGEGRGGRGYGRSSSGRGGDFRGESSAAPIALSDDSLFPSL